MFSQEIFFKGKPHPKEFGLEIQPLEILYKDWKKMVRKYTLKEMFNL